MSSVRTAGLISVLLLLGSSSLAGQTLGPRELEARIDSLLPIRDRAMARAAVADSLATLERRRRGAVESERIRVGPLSLVVRSGQTEEAREIMGDTWEHFEPLLGEQALELFQDHVFTFHVYAGLRDRIFVERPEDRIQRVEINAAFGEDRLREKAANAVATVLSEGLDPELRSWGRITAPGVLRRDEWLYREMITASSVAVRRCLEGELERCWEAVDATQTDGDRWERLYTPADRMELALEAGRPSSYGGTEKVTLYERCVGQGADDACADFLRQTYGEDYVPLSVSARSALLGLALERGGEGAFTRLAGSEGSIRSRLEAAAQMDSNELMAAWLERIREARPRRMEGAPATRWSTLFWILVLGFLATRSTRWRLD